MSQTPILEVKNLSVSFTTNDGIVDAVKNVNFELFQGETLAIVGESGSGKSVSTNAVMQLLPKNGIVDKKSQILFEGQQLLTLPEKAMQTIRGDKTVWYDFSTHDITKPLYASRAFKLLRLLCAIALSRALKQNKKYWSYLIWFTCPAHNKHTVNILMSFPVASCNE